MKAEIIHMQCVIIQNWPQVCGRKSFNTAQKKQRPLSQDRSEEQAERWGWGIKGRWGFKIVSVEGMRQNSLSVRNKGQSSAGASCAKKLSQNHSWLKLASVHSAATNNKATVRLWEGVQHSSLWGLHCGRHTTGPLDSESSPYLPPSICDSKKQTP